MKKKKIKKPARKPAKKPARKPAKKPARKPAKKPARKPAKKPARQRSKHFKNSRKYKKIDTRSGETFRIYTKDKRLSRSPPLNLDNFRRYFETNIIPEFHKFWYSQRSLGRTQFIFRLKTQLFIFKDKVKEFFSSFRNDVITEEEFDDQMERLILEFLGFLQNYITKGVLNHLTISGISIEVSIPNSEPDNNARVAKKAKGKKKNAKKVVSGRHRKR